MSAPAPFWPDSLRSIAPWLLATAASLAAFVILSMFIDTLHLSMQRGEALRATLMAQGAARQGTAIQVADAGTDTPSGSR